MHQSQPLNRMAILIYFDDQIFTQDSVPLAHKDPMYELVSSYTKQTKRNAFIVNYNFIQFLKVHL